MKNRTRRLATGLGLLAFAGLLVGGWEVYDAWTTPHASGLEIKDGAALSIIPYSAALVSLVWGLVLLWKARR